MKKITYKKFMEFYHRYYKERAYPNQRFGQAFLNHLPDSAYMEPDPELFYEEDDKKAHQLAVERYVIT